MRTLLKGSKNLQNNGMSISKPLSRPSSLKPDPIPPEASLSPSHIRLSYPSSLIIPPTSHRMKPAAINKQNSRPSKSHSKGPKSPEKRQIQPQSAPRQKLNFLDLTHEKKPNNSKNQVISVVSTPEDPPIKQRGASPGLNRRLNFESDEISARKFARLKKLQSAGLTSPSTSHQKSGKFKIKELLKEKENKRRLKFQNEILRDMEDILENNEKYQVDLTVTGEDLNMEGHSEETESVCSYDESTSSTREYCVYEDWKLIEAAKQYKRVTGNTMEPRIWAEIIDLETNRKLLEGRRDAKSMAKRYGNYLIYLNQEVIKVIQGMAKALTLKELKRLKIAFKDSKQGNGEKELAYIYKNVKGKIDRLSSSTLKNFYELSQEVEDFSSQEKEIVIDSGEIESDEIEEVEEIIQPEVTAMSVVSEDIPNFNDSQLSFSARRKPRRLNENNPPADDIINVDDEDVLFQSNKTGKKKMKGNNGKEVIIKNPLQERVPSSTSQSIEEVKYPKKVQDEIIKKRRKNWEYDKKSLIASKKFESRRATRKFDFDPNLCLFVDLEHQFRQFVKTDNEVIIDEEEEGDLVGNQLSAFASKYGCTLQEIGDLFKQASCNLKELEKYLKTKNVNILWNSQEDADLRENNQIALKYLMRTKGAERIKERRMYLKKVDRRHTNVIISD